MSTRGGALYAPLFCWKDDRMKNQLKQMISFLLGGLLMTSISVYAVTTLYEANEVGYDNSSSGTRKTEVQSALDELYELSESAESITGNCNQVAKPNLGTDLIPITLSNDGTVTYADTSTEWYNYCEKEWANAIHLIDNPSKEYKIGDIIEESDIRSYFVWIPKYKYKLWNVNVTDTLTLAHSIDIIFDTNNTTDIEGESCATPMNSGESGNCNNGEYMTHPAFISMDVDGFWVGKFEPTGSITNITVKPNLSSIRNLNVYNLFVNSYNYSRENDSHMMKNTEWGAVAYLSHSIYGIDDEVNINNNSSFITGSSSLLTLQQGTYLGTYGNGSNYNMPYNTELGYLASTTGNITGIYDMSGGSHEFVAAYRENTYGSSGFNATNIKNYDSKYFDVYLSNSTQTTYQNRILGDATGEMGPFITFKDGDGGSRIHNQWYSDFSPFVSSFSPWFMRGNCDEDGVLAGQFALNSNAGVANIYYSFRLVLTPQNMV